MTPLDSVELPVGLSFDIAVSHPIATRLAERFRAVRETSRRLAGPLSAEDMVAQSMPDTSPAKWHLAHTTWFFETFFLLPRGHAPFDPAFQFLFNSYYEALGERQPRAARGLITRPGSAEVMAYRDHVDAAIAGLLAAGEVDPETAALFELGFSHEQQHQELLLTDLLHLFTQNRLKPAYLPPVDAAAGPPPPACTFTAFEGGVREIGHAGPGFAFDNEGPRHQVLLRPFKLADRLVVNAEWLAFMEDGGYRRPELWLSDGWSCREAQDWHAPLYWEAGEGGAWRAFGLRGMQPLNPTAPVMHISFYEADAFARWADRRLPTEAEWEVASAQAGAKGAFLEEGRLEARPAGKGALAQMFGDLWEWTASPYIGYPGFKPVEGAVGEYNGKFMINQMVLRGGSCVTSEDHMRATYRNFFQPHQRWQFSGVRLATD